MRTHVSVAGLLFFVGFFVTQVDLRAGDELKKSVELLPRWKKGEKLNFEMVKTRKDLKNGKVTQTITVRTPLEVEVLDLNKDGSELRWTTGESKFDDPKIAENPIVRNMSNLLKGLNVVMAMDSQGSMNGVKNWKEVKEKSTKLLEAMSDELEKAGIEKAMVAKIRAQATSLFTTKEQVEQLCTREPQMYFLVLGKTYTPSKTLEFEGVLPNPLGGESVPCRAVFNLQGIDKKTGHTVIRWRQTVDPKEAKRIMEKTLKDLATKIGRPVPDGELLKSMTIEESGECSVDPSSGWIHRFTNTRIVTSGKRAVEETTTIVRK